MSHESPERGEKSSRVTAVLSAGARGYAPDPVSNSSAKHSLPRNDSREARGFVLQRRQWSEARRVLWPDAALEQSSNRSRELSAAALPVSVSRHLVSTSVQFGQSAAGKTESDQWPFSRLSV